MNDAYVYGIHAVRAIIANPLRSVKQIFIVQESANQRLQQLLEQLPESAVIKYMSAQAMKQTFGAYKHQGVVAVVNKLANYSERDLPELLSLIKKPALILILDGVTDPHNLGACLRSADGAGVDFVIIPKHKSAPVTPTVSKVACGATELIPVVQVNNLVRVITLLKEHNLWVYGAAGEASQSLYTLNVTNSAAIVLGSEDKGLRRLTREHCDGLFSLPMLGGVSSLNVSVATGICLYEIRRQQGASTNALYHRV